jgi:hypothetical protein
MCSRCPGLDSHSQGASRDNCRQSRISDNKNLHLSFDEPTNLSAKYFVKNQTSVVYLIEVYLIQIPRKGNMAVSNLFHFAIHFLTFFTVCHIPLLHSNSIGLK